MQILNTDNQNITLKMLKRGFIRSKNDTYYKLQQTKKRKPKKATYP